MFPAAGTQGNRASGRSSRVSAAALGDGADTYLAPSPHPACWSRPDARPCLDTPPPQKTVTLPACWSGWAALRHRSLRTSQPACGRAAAPSAGRCIQPSRHLAHLRVLGDGRSSSLPLAPLASSCLCPPLSGLPFADRAMSWVGQRSTTAPRWAKFINQTIQTSPTKETSCTRLLAIRLVADRAMSGERDRRPP